MAFVGGGDGSGAHSHAQKSDAHVTRARAFRCARCTFFPLPDDGPRRRHGRRVRDVHAAVPFVLCARTHKTITDGRKNGFVDRSMMGLADDVIRIAACDMRYAGAHHVTMRTGGA